LPNIAIVWDFDGTLTPLDSTTKAVEIIGEGRGEEFWATIRKLTDNPRAPEWRHVLASHAPAWMYSLSRIAFARKIPLNAETFKEIAPHIKLYPKVLSFLRKLKLLEETGLFRDTGVEIHYFIVSAGLQELVSQILPEDLITWTFGCRYIVNAFQEDPTRPESIPVFCMDETMKTRSLFEISKGSFRDKDSGVNRRIPHEKLWAPFENVIYVGDGDTDVPALSLVRHLGGLGIAVYDPDLEPSKRKKKLENLSLDERADLITPANFDAGGELFEYLEARCLQIALRYRASKAI
jgi:2-hydroxy-3-keto-5-methylthiopentenyl-1-phosphate phosphatase